MIVHLDIHRSTTKGYAIADVMIAMSLISELLDSFGKPAHNPDSTDTATEFISFERSIFSTRVQRRTYELGPETRKTAVRR